MSRQCRRTVRVTHMTGDRFAIRIRGHSLAADQPVGNGGMDAAPTPVELFVAGLASCVAHYARGYLVRHHVDERGLSVTADFDMGGRPTRVTEIRLQLTPPPALPIAQYPAFRAVAGHCTVHNTLRVTPVISLQIDDSDEEARHDGSSSVPRAVAW
jgi:putative redox protein